MKYRRLVLKQLDRLYQKKGPNNFLYADELNGFSPGDEEFLAAIDQLRKEDLIHCTADEKVPGEYGMQARLAVALNPDAVDRVRKELTSWYQDARFLIPAAIALAALLWSIIKELL